MQNRIIAGGEEGLVSFCRLYVWSGSAKQWHVLPLSWTEVERLDYLWMKRRGLFPVGLHWIMGGRQPGFGTGAAECRIEQTYVLCQFAFHSSLINRGICTLQRADKAVINSLWTEAGVGLQGLQLIMWLHGWLSRLLRRHKMGSTEEGCDRIIINFQMFFLFGQLKFTLSRREFSSESMCFWAVMQRSVSQRSLYFISASFCGM